MWHKDLKFDPRVAKTATSQNEIFYDREDPQGKGSTPPPPRELDDGLASPLGGAKSPLSPPPEAARSWAAEEVKALEAALAKFPPSLPPTERWRAIGKEVGRGAKECLEKVKAIAAAQKAAAEGGGESSSGLEATRDDIVRGGVDFVYVCGVG